MIRALVGRGGPALLAFFLSAAGAAALFLPRFGVDASTSLLLNEDDPDLGFYNRTRALWEYDDYVIVCWERDEWFTPEAVGLLRGFTDAVTERVPHVQKQTSILTVPLLRNLKPAFLGLPQPATLGDPRVDLARAKEELVAHTQARGNLVSEDGRNLSVLVHLDVPLRVVELDPLWSVAQADGNRAEIERLRPDYEAALGELRDRRTAMVRALRSVCDEWAPKIGSPVRLSGLPIINVNLIEHVEADLRTFGAASFALFTLAFLAVYRSFRWTAGPILACLLPVVLVTGAMAALDWRITVITSNLPILLFVLMLPYAVYFVERYRERRAAAPGESNLDAVAGAAADVWTPCLFSCLTTMAGFLSLLTSGINPVRTFGGMMSLGMGAGILCVLLFLPAFARPFRPQAGAAAGAATQPRGVVRLFSRLVLAAPGAVALAGLLVLGASIWGASRIRVETKFIDYFWPSSEVYRGLDYIDTRMGGTTPLEIILTSETEGFFKTPEGLAAIEAASAYLGSVPETGNVRSFKTLIDEVRKAMPKAKDAQLVGLATTAAKELVREFSTPDHKVTRVLARFRETAPTLHRNNLLRGLREDLAARPELAGIRAEPTGIFLLYANMLNSLVESQRKTFGIVVLAIFLMLVVLFRALALPAVVLIPQVLPALACLGVMGWAGIPLDLVTVMIASIAMGVGIDSAIQYTVRFRKELEACGGDLRAAIPRAHATIGRAIWIATSIVVAGFAVLSLSAFVPTVTFGLFTALAMLMGQLASLTVLPSLLLLLRLPRLTPPAREG